MKKRNKKLRKHNKSRKKQDQSLLNMSYRKAGGNMIVGIIMGFITIFVSIVTIIWFFSPKISASPSFFINPKNALSMQFVISNNGNTSIKNVKFLVSIRNIKTSDGLNIIGDPNFKSRLTEANNIVPALNDGESYTVQFPPQFMIGNNLDSADIALVVHFTIPFLPSRPFERIFRYNACKDTEGKFHWSPQPLSKE